MPKVSVVIPVRNGLPYIGEAIESIIAQTFLDWELIIIDDASTDGTQDVIKSYAAKDARIRWFANDERQGEHSRSIGIAKATGEYTAMMDGDDISLPKRLERQVAYMDAHPDIVMSGCWAKEFGDSNWLYAYFASNYMIDTLAPFRYTFHSPTIIMRRDKITETYGHRAIGEDTLFVNRMQLKHRTGNLCEILYHYRVHSASVTKRADPVPGYMRQFAETFSIFYGFIPTERQLQTHLSWLGLANDVGLLEQWQWILFMAKHPRYRWDQRAVLLAWCAVGTGIKLAKSIITG